jgi:hypothetical protein
MVSSSSSATSLFSRRDFIGRTSQWSAALAAYKFLPLPALRPQRKYPPICLMPRSGSILIYCLHRAAQG